MPESSLLCRSTVSPITYLIARDGTVAGYITGTVDWSRADAQALLAYYRLH